MRKNAVELVASSERKAVTQSRYYGAPFEEVVNSEQVRIIGLGGEAEGLDILERRTEQVTRLRDHLEAIRQKIRVRVDSALRWLAVKPIQKNAFCCAGRQNERR